MVDGGGINDRWWLLVDVDELNVQWLLNEIRVRWWYISLRKLIERKLLLYCSEGNWSWEQHSREESVHKLIAGFQRLPQIYLAALFCKASSNWISPRLWGLAAYSMVGWTIVLYAAHFAVQLQPNIDLRRWFRDLVPLLTTNLHCLNQVNLESTNTYRITPRNRSLINRVGKLNWFMFVWNHQCFTFCGVQVKLPTRSPNSNAIQVILKGHAVLQCVCWSIY